MVLNPQRRSQAVRCARAIVHRGWLKRCVIYGWYIAGVTISYMLAFLIRFEGDFNNIHWKQCYETMPVLIILSLLVFNIFRLYQGLWRYVSFDEIPKIICAVFSASAVFTASLYFLGDQFRGYPRSVIIIYTLLELTWVVGGRMLARYLRERLDMTGIRSGTKKIASSDNRILLVGHLDYIDLFLRSAHGFNLSIGKIVGVVTDHKSAQGGKFRGALVGWVYNIGEIASENKINTILCLPPYTEKAELSGIVKSCNKADVICDFRMIPSVMDLASGVFEVSSIKKVEIEDLLGRSPVRMDRAEVRSFVKDKAVMVTGAGGSIGSELCRQIVTYGIKKLILFELSELALYKIEQELKDIELRSKSPSSKNNRPTESVELISIAGDIREPGQIRHTIRTHGVQIIYHAAAYKHVPLMEKNVGSCIHTNSIGTWNIARVAAEEKVERMVMISTDKAVRPTSVMGCSKRIAERLVMEQPDSETDFVAVRFGNVLGSSGSVIPLFKSQIESGGPVTVTTPNMTRFFMTIPEAVDLVLQSGAVGHDRDIMVLEMGESVKIHDLARNLIELSGFRPDHDIKIEFIGMRPGEKEYEELLTDDEDVVRTAHDKIWVMRKNDDSKLPEISTTDLRHHIINFHDESLRKLVTTYVPDNKFDIAGIVEDISPQDRELRIRKG